MGQYEVFRVGFRDLKKRGAVKREKLANAALGGFDLAVDPVGGKNDKKGRNFRQQDFESQLVVEFSMLSGFK